MIKNLLMAFVLAASASVANASIVRAYNDADGSGTVTYTDLGSNQLQIELDNTSLSPLSSIITGLVFDITDDINAMTIASFVDGSSADLTSFYNISLNVNNNITPGNTQVDLAITTTNGINGGIYNAASPGNTNNAMPDIAVLILNITDPNPWTLSAIENDILRMQRTGSNGSGSLKTPGVPAVPVPAAVWLFGSGLIGLIGVARRKKS